MQHLAVFLVSFLDCGGPPLRRSQVLHQFVDCLLEGFVLLLQLGHPRFLAAPNHLPFPLFGQSIGAGLSVVGEDLRGDSVDALHMWGVG